MPASGGEGDHTARRPEAWRKAMELLVRREQSRRDLQRKLAAKGYEADEAAAAIDRLVAAGYQDDGRFGACFARDRAAAGYGPVRIRQELAGHGLTGEQVEAALEACDLDWADRLAAVVSRRFRAAELADPARRRKAVDFLIRRGFEPGRIQDALRQVAADD